MYVFVALREFKLGISGCFVKQEQWEALGLSGGITLGKN